MKASEKLKRQSAAQDWNKSSDCKSLLHMNRCEPERINDYLRWAFLSGYDAAKAELSNAEKARGG